MCRVGCRHVGAQVYRGCACAANLEDELIAGLEGPADKPVKAVALAQRLRARAASACSATPGLVRRRARMDSSTPDSRQAGIQGLVPCEPGPGQG